MTEDLTVPARWVEGHIAELDLRAAGCEHAIRAALSVAGQRPHREELAEVLSVRAQWREVQLLITARTRPRRGR